MTGLMRPSCCRSELLRRPIRRAVGGHITFSYNPCFGFLHIPSLGIPSFRTPLFDGLPLVRAALRLPVRRFTDLIVLRRLLSNRGGATTLSRCIDLRVSVPLCLALLLIALK